MPLCTYLSSSDINCSQFSVNFMDTKGHGIHYGTLNYCFERFVLWGVLTENLILQNKILRRMEWVN